MSIDLEKLAARDAEGHFRVVVESPRGSQVKLKYDPELRLFTMSRPLALGVRYPYEWGFVPGTRGDDGDPLDAMVLLDVPTYPGVVLTCRALGTVELTQKKKGAGGRRERNDRVIAVPVNAPRCAELDDAGRLPERVRRELEEFFVAVTALEDKDARVEGWGSAAEAEAAIDRAIAGAAGAKR